MPECIFCKIVRGKLPSTRIYEDKNMLALMDIRPITTGHIIVIPKEHRELLTELDEDLVGEMLVTAKKVGGALKRSKLNCRGINYILSDGADAGQEIFHVHMHIIPRYRGDGFAFSLPKRDDENTDQDRLEKTAIKIRKGLEV